MRLPGELVAIFLSLIGLVAANTEIVNFDASPSPQIALRQASQWQVLGSNRPQALLRILPAPLDTSIEAVCEPTTASTSKQCPHEQWLVLDLDEPKWLQYQKFTLRVSWPASYPADFFVDIHSPQSADALLHNMRHHSHVSDAPLTRKKFARIRLVNTGVLTPSPENEGRTVEPVPFIVMVEPLYLGVLPMSLLPTVAFLLIVAAGAGFVVLPRVNRLLFTVVEEVRAENSTVEVRRRR
ncbi:hypothetical protein C8Q78DRAFT_1076872 [Trametes maxima]|nr:hypothetical protein C8Q78DRAFT_1076872 [Trametes maxima]